jgi:poly-gamma-glutamate capsule biosynthesis protein CapA/YwtB (metallophosphatase superfamily)
VVLRRSRLCDCGREEALQDANMKRILALLAALLFASWAAPSKSAPAAGLVPDGFTFVAGGDMIGPDHSLKGAENPGFEQIADLFRHADLDFANQEGSIFDLKKFAGYPSAENGGGYPLYPVETARVLKAAGIRVVSKANNHVIDWGPEGLVATLKTLTAAGIAQAGAGLSLAEARQPVYIDTPKGVAALISTASTFPPAAVAGPAIERHGVKSRPRPGLSPLHVRQINLITDDQLAALRVIAGPVASPVPGKANELRVSDQIFRASKHDGTTWEMDPGDEAAILTSIGEARSKARFVVFTIHAHETAGNVDDMPAAEFEAMVLHKANEAPSPDDPEPADFLPVLFHKAIDAGADAVVRTGPHSLNGIEIYKGRPIFYSLGSLIFDFHGARTYRAPDGIVKYLPDNWFETVIPVCTFKNGRVSEIRLHPAVIDSSGDSSGGLPHPANPEQTRHILQRIKSLSARFGTIVTIKGDIGIIRPVYN